MKKAKAKVEQLKKDQLNEMVKEKRESAVVNTDSAMKTEQTEEKVEQKPKGRAKSAKNAKEPAKEEANDDKGKGKGKAKGKKSESNQTPADNEDAGASKKKQAGGKGDKSEDYWKIELVSNTLLGDLKDGITDYITKYVKPEFEGYQLEEDDLEYAESEKRKNLQDNERDIGRKLRQELCKADKFMNVIIGNSFSVKLLKNYPHADFKVGPIRLFIFSGTRHMK